MKPELHPHLQAIGDSLSRSLDEHVAGNGELAAAFVDLRAAMEHSDQPSVVAPDASK